MAVERSTLTVALDTAASERGTSISRLFQQIEDTRKLDMTALILRKLETAQDGSMAGEVDVADEDQDC